MQASSALDEDDKENQALVQQKIAQMKEEFADPSKSIKVESSAMVRLLIGDYVQQCFAKETKRRLCLAASDYE